MANYTKGAARRLSRSMAAEARKVHIGPELAAARLAAIMTARRVGLDVAVEHLRAVASFDIGQAMRHLPSSTTQARIAEVRAAMQAFLDGPSAERLIYLRCRWLDEREHEDWSDYVAELRKLVPDGFEFERAGKSPFGFNVTAPGMPGAMMITATTTEVRIKHIRI